VQSRTEQFSARWGRWSTPRPDRFNPRKETRYQPYRWLSGPQGQSGQAHKISPPPGFDPRTVQPVVSRFANRGKNGYSSNWAGAKPMCTNSRLMDNILQSTAVRNFSTPFMVFARQLQTDSAVPRCTSCSVDTLRTAPRRVASQRHSDYGDVSMRKYVLRELTCRKPPTVAQALSPSDTQYWAVTHLSSRVNGTSMENRRRKKPTHNGDMTVGNSSAAAAAAAVLCVLGYGGSGLQCHRSTTCPVWYRSMGSSEVHLSGPTKKRLAGQRSARDVDVKQAATSCLYS
jgi:hypothetical protein